MKHFSAFIFLFIPLQILAQKSDFKDIDFKKADKIAKVFKGNNLHNLPLLTHNLTDKLETDVEKFRAIYLWISTNIKGNYAMYRKVSRKRKKFKNDSISLLNWNNEYTKKVFKDLLKNKRTMCTGYAYLLKTMTNIANIECKIVDGYGRNISANIGELSAPNHSWNAVKLNNKWYLADATWSSGYTDLNTNTFIFDYNDGYFLTEPKLFIKNHYPLHKKWTLIPQETSAETFIHAPLVYGKVFKFGFIPISPIKMDNEIAINKEVVFAYQLLKPLDANKIQLMITNGTNGKLLKPKIELKNEVLNIKHQFDKKGFFDIHLLYNGKTLVTYTFNVKK